MWLTEQASRPSMQSSRCEAAASEESREQAVAWRHEGAGTEKEQAVYG
jgi:hypothetical protein